MVTLIIVAVLALLLGVTAGFLLGVKLARKFIYVIMARMGPQELDDLAVKVQDERERIASEALH